MSIRCRTCAEKIFNKNAKNLFEQDDNEILLNIETITGMRLREDHHMPKHICNCCYLDLYYSITFRERCIKAEKLMQQSKQKASTISTTLDPLNAEEAKSLPPAVVKDAPNLRSPGTEIPSDHSPQRRILRTRTKFANTIIEKIRKMRRKRSYGFSPFKTTSVPATGPDTKNLLHDQTSGSIQKDCKEIPGTSTKDLNIDEVIASASALDQLSKASSPVNLSSPMAVDFESNDIEQQKAERASNVSTKNEKCNARRPDHKIYMCDLCGQQSSSVKNLDIHIMRHKGDKKFECEECGEKHYSAYLLKLHVRTKHNGEMPFECKYCGQRFFSGSARLRHEQVRHIRNFNYECKVCGKKYLTKSCLNKHEFLHTGQRPYRCDLCNVGFPRKPGLRIHCRTKQHQKRASEALTSQQNIIKEEITVPDETILFTEAIMEELDL